MPTRQVGLKITKWASVLAIVGLAAQGGYLVHSRLRTQDTSPQEMRIGGPIPYTAILRETVHGPDGATSIAADTTLAVRSDGSTARRLSHKGVVGHSNGVVREIGDVDSERVLRFASGIEATINELAETKSTTIMKNVNPARWQRDPSSKCINSFAGAPMTSLPEVISGEEIVAGYRTVKITINGERIVTFWYALDHGCAMVKSRIDFGGQEFSEQNLVALIPGEPEAVLFHVPAHAKEAPPSQRALGLVKKDGKSCNVRCAELYRKLDQDYYARRATN